MASLLNGLSAGVGSSAIYDFLQRFRQELLTILALSFLANMLMLTPTIYLLQVFDRVIISQNAMTLLVITFLAFSMFAVIVFAEWLRTRFLVDVGVRFDQYISPILFEQVHRARLYSSSQAHLRVFHDLAELRQFVTGQGVIALTDFPWSVVYVAVLFILHPFLGWLAIVFLALQSLLIVRSHLSALSPIAQAQAAQMEETKFLASKVRGEEVIEVLGMRSAFQGAWEGKREANLVAASASQSVIHRNGAQIKFLRLCQQSLSLAAGALLVIKGELSPGAMIAANILVSRALAPMDILSTSWKQWLTAKESYERLTSLECEDRQFVKLGTTTAIARRPSGAVRLIDVVVKAPDGSLTILSKVNLELRPGTLSLIMGESGSGKTTLGQVIIGIWPNFSGQVVWDRTPIIAWSRESLGPYVGYLPQNIELLAGTVAENIARFGHDQSESIVEAARLAGLHEKILRLPKGYDSLIGEAGRLLSAGERQRLALARAVFAKPALVVLDEPNSNMDDEGEKFLTTTINQLKASGSIVVVISHRPALIGLADQSIEVAEGTVRVMERRAS